MEILFLICGTYFTQGYETMKLITEGFVPGFQVNTCDDCYKMIRNPAFDESEMISDAQLGL